MATPAPFRAWPDGTIPAPQPRRRIPCQPGQLLDAIDDAIDALENDPGDAAVRRRCFGDGLWGIPVRDRTEDWLIIWERDPAADNLIANRYLGTDPFA
jgi:hypothetical protein